MANHPLSDCESRISSEISAPHERVAVRQGDLAGEFQRQLNAGERNDGGNERFTGKKLPHPFFVPRRQRFADILIRLIRLPGFATLMIPKRRTEAVFEPGNTLFSLKGSSS